MFIGIQQGNTCTLCLACGAIPNCDNASEGMYPVRPPKSLPECIGPCCVENGCYKRDNKHWEHKHFRASPELLNDLEALFQDGENRTKGGTKRNAGKYNATEAMAIVHKKNPDFVQSHCLCRKEFTETKIQITEFL